MPNYVVISAYSLTVGQCTRREDVLKSYTLCVITILTYAVLNYSMYVKNFKFLTHLANTTCVKLLSNHIADCCADIIVQPLTCSNLPKGQCSFLLTFHSRVLRLGNKIQQVS